MSEPARPSPLQAYAWVAPAIEPAGPPEEPADPADLVDPADPAADDATGAEFERRVAERLRTARYRHSLKRTVFSPRELATRREIEHAAAVWVPVITFAVTAVCAVLVVLLATSVARNPGHGRMADLLVAVVTLGLLVAGFATLTRSQEHFDGLRPSGREIRCDLADAYETVRDGAAVFVELGVPPAALSRVADLQPQAERLVDFLVALEGKGRPVRGHPAYEQLILMGVEVTVLTDMAEERLGRRSSRRRDRNTEDRVEQRVEETTLTTFETLADLVAMLGPDVPRTRRLS